jgi:hypothetical protein
MSQAHSFSDFLTRPSSSWTGVIALLSLGVIGNLVTGLIGLLSGTSVVQLALWVLSILALLGGIYWIWRRPEPLVLVPQALQPPRRRGLIVLVGTGRPGEDPMRQSAWSAIEYHFSQSREVGLERCWLIATAGEKGSLPIAQELEKLCSAKNIVPIIRTVADPFSVQESYELVQRIYEQEVPENGLLESDVIADFTGGVKPMSAGMILACGDRRMMQYMYGRKQGVASTPRLVEFAPRGQQRR